MSLVVKLYSPSQLLTQTTDGNRPESTKKKEVERPRLRPMSWMTWLRGGNSTLTCGLRFRARRMLPLSEFVY